jgi:hypothetical protein
MGSFCVTKLTIGLLFVSSLLAFLALGPSVWAQHVWEVDVSGEEYNPNNLTAAPGDTIRFCNQGIWRRQPFTGNQYNRFGNRNPETYEMISKGECKSLKVQNPSSQLLKFTVHDAVAPKGQLKVSVSPGK